MKDKKLIQVRGAKEQNLKNISIDIPKDSIVVFTGVSGSGKSSIAFDTVYAEGRRLYLESLSSYAKQFESNNKPQVDSITGLTPSIAIDQKTTSRNPRSTVATVTEIYDYLRMLFARIGTPYSPATGLPIKKQSSKEIIAKIKNFPEGTEAVISAPVFKSSKSDPRKEIISLKKQGFTSIKINGKEHSMLDLPLLAKGQEYEIEAIVGKIKIGAEDKQDDISKTVIAGLNAGSGVINVEISKLPEEYKEKALVYHQHKEESADILGITKSNDDFRHATPNEMPKNNDICMHEGGILSSGLKISMSEKFTCPVSGFSLSEIEPRDFSFNSPYGACKVCNGMGTEKFFAPHRIIPNPLLSLEEGALAPWASKFSPLTNSKREELYNKILKSLADHYKFSINTPFKNLSTKFQQLILYGSSGEKINFNYSHEGKAVSRSSSFEGIIAYLEQKAKKAENQNILEQLETFQDTRECTACSGYRLSEEALCVKIERLHIGNVCEMSIRDAQSWFCGLEGKLNESSTKIAERMVAEIEKRLKLLNNVGLSYLTLDRRSNTLSGGESQRIRLATQIGSGLSSVLYVLDEPSIGLHQYDNEKLISTIKALKEQGNTVLIVEHDEDTMRAADYLIELGPGAGIHGGEVVAQGTPEEIANNPNSLTGAYLSGRLAINVPESRRSNAHNFIKVRKASENNLKNIDLDIPLNNFIAFTGVSGSGKSTFVIDTLYKTAARKVANASLIPGACESISGLEYIDKVIEVDQSAIGRTPRSNPATYTNVFTPIREWFAALPEAKARGYQSSRFSFNIKGGRCEACEGDGVIKIKMYFLPDVYVPCEECKGKRYNDETLQITHNGVSISDILSMTCEDALNFFKDVENIHDKLIALCEVGLGYLHVGQSATTLSGGEAQRIKLAKELARRSVGHTLYIFDEPTTGLHSHDISKLLKVFNKLVDANNTVIVIEHNLDVIKTADYIVDFGPFGGDKGGEIIAIGTPEEVSKCENSLTGQYLKKYLK